MLDLKAVGFDVVVVFDGQRPLAKMANEKRLHDRFARIDNDFDADAKGNARVASKLLRELVVPTDAMLDRVKTAFTNTTSATRRRRSKLRSRSRTTFARSAFLNTIGRMSLCRNGKKMSVSVASYSSLWCVCRHALIHIVNVC
jgi:hypothetical protein